MIEDYSTNFEGGTGQISILKLSEMQSLCPPNLADCVQSAQKSFVIQPRLNSEMGPILDLGCQRSCGSSIKEQIQFCQGECGGFDGTLYQIEDRKCQQQPLCNQTHWISLNNFSSLNSSSMLNVTLNIEDYSQKFHFKLKYTHMNKSIEWIQKSWIKESEIHGFQLLQNDFKYGNSGIFV